MTKTLLKPATRRPAAKRDSLPAAAETSPSLLTRMARLLLCASTVLFYAFGIHGRPVLEIVSEGCVQNTGHVEMGAHLFVTLPALVYLTFSILSGRGRLTFEDTYLVINSAGVAANLCGVAVIILSGNYCLHGLILMAPNSATFSLGVTTLAFAGIGLWVTVGGIIAASRLIDVMRGRDAGERAGLMTV